MIGQITERMETVKADLEKQFTNLYCKKDFEYQLKAAAAAADSRKPQIIKKLADMYNEVGVACEYNRSLSYYERLFSALKVSESVADVNNKIINMMCSLYAEYPKPEEYMERIVNCLDPDTALCATLELRILRRFLQTVNVKENKKYFSKTLGERVASDGIEAVDATVFEALKTKPEGKCDYLPLLQACYNLAHGIFISPASTKELLFLFAFAYDMRYYPSQEQADYDVTRDIEKNLFVDYYCDNLTRFLVSDTGALSGTSDNEPSGFVMNPKNFADVVFVYYLNRVDIAVEDRVSGFFASINQIKKLWKETKGYLPESRHQYEQIPTQLYKNKLGEAFFSLSAEQMISYVLANYYCDVRYSYINKKTGELDEGSKGIFELAFTTNTAYAQYKDILSLIKEELSISEDAVFSKVFDRLDHRTLLNDSDLEKRSDFATNSDVKYKIELKQWYEKDSIEAMSALSLFENTAALGEEVFFTPIANYEQSVKRDFITIIKNIEKRLNPEFALCINDALSITRTKLIAAYYHYFCLEAGTDALCLGTWKNFKDVYEEMGGCVSDYLEDAGYQKISPKNLFDIFVVFLAYCKINDFLN